LLAEDFISEKLDSWMTFDEGTSQGPSLWSVESGTLSQDSNIHSFDGSEIAKFGTYLLYAGSENRGGDSVTPDYEIRLTVRSEDDDALGVMFRYQDPDNYYRFSWDSQRRYRRLVKRENGIFTLLAEDGLPYSPGQTHDWRIVADGSILEIWIDDYSVFSVVDSSFSEGTIALYSWGNRGSYFDDVVVEDLAMGVVILSENFDDGNFDRWTIFDEGEVSGPSSWSAASGTLVQNSNIHSFAGSDIAKFGTFAVYK